MLCSQTSPTVQNVCPVTKKLLSEVEPLEDDVELVKLMKNTMYLELTNRTQTENIPVLASLLNPDTKHLPFMSGEERDMAHKLLKEKAEALTVKVKQEIELVLILS